MITLQFPPVHDLYHVHLKRGRDACGNTGKVESHRYRSVRGSVYRVCRDTTQTSRLGYRLGVTYVASCISGSVLHLIPYLRPVRWDVIAARLLYSAYWLHLGEIINK
jgi:hypothetical protein